ncbi:TonB family protein [Flagellimonas sp.]|uniref:TonB family protein n=1 Tax=Flagellimonas sp. TaxID=2058762 RepID=UPI003F49E64A
MISYVLEIVAIQLLFLLAYDFFLRKETFFQWNRIYLITSFTLSIILPWIKIETLETSAIRKFEPIRQFFFQLDEIVLTSNDTNNTFWQSLHWNYVILLFGALIMFILLCVKLDHLYRIKKSGLVTSKQNYIEVIIPKSKHAFSFFKYVFIGELIPKQKRKEIIIHEMVHVRQRHSIDLMFFEIMRVVFWFNPLVYLFQNRIADVHEFIADSELHKLDKAKQYDLLLYDVFQSQKFSLVNHFFKKSLIKKRIVMLTKQKSNPILRLKYMFLIPITFSILLYSSCEESPQEKSNVNALNQKNPIDLEGMTIVGYSRNDSKKTLQLNVGNLNSLTKEEKLEQEKMLDQLLKSKTSTTILIMDNFGNSAVMEIKDGVTTNMSVNKISKEDSDSESVTSIPFSTVDEVPVFPGCENATDKKKCFLEKIQLHVRENFNYPKVAQEQGIQGRVNILFSIDTDGKVVGIQKKGPHELLTNEAERIISKLPKMQAARHKGEEVEMPFSIPITFKLK